MSDREFYAYLNGEFLPESQATISIRDVGWLHGDAVFDASRTFNGVVFKLEQHIERLYLSLKYARINPGLTPAEMLDTSRQLLERNVPMLAEGEDMWIAQRISRGAPTPQGMKPTVLIECKQIPFAVRAEYYHSGIPAVTPSVRRVPPEAVSPQVKTHNYFNFTIGQEEVAHDNPSAWSVLLDTRGHLCEGNGANIFVVKEGELFTPKVQYVLNGISRQTVIELAGQLSLAVHELDIGPYEAYTADEIFLTSTSLCLCGISTFNGVTVGEGQFPGPVTKRLQEAYSDLVGRDIVQQYLDKLSQGLTPSHGL